MCVWVYFLKVIAETYPPYLKCLSNISNLFRITLQQYSYYLYSINLVPRVVSNGRSYYYYFIIYYHAVYYTVLYSAQNGYRLIRLVAIFELNSQYSFVCCIEFTCVSGYTCFYNFLFTRNYYNCVIVIIMLSRCFRIVRPNIKTTN